MSSADIYTIQASASTADEAHSVPVINRRTLVVNDMNNTSYGSQEAITYDLSTISNSSQYIDWKQSFAQFPMTLAVETTDKSADYASKFTASLKNGHFSILRAIDVKLSNMNVINLTSNIAQKISYELVSTMSADDAERCDRFGYAFEDGTNWSYKAVASPDGLGICSTGVSELNPKATSAAEVASLKSAMKPNLGRKRRCLALSDSADFSGVVSEATLKTAGLSVRLANVGNVMYYTYLCRVPFEIIHDYFRQCPLMKNSLYSMSFYLNAPCSVECTMTAQAASFGATAEAHTYALSAPTLTLPYDELPVELGSARAGDGFTDGASGTSVKATLTCTTKNSQKTCSLHLSMLTLDPSVEKSYLSNPVKSFNYEEVFVHKINTIPAGSPVHQLVNANVSRVRKMVILPYFTGEGLLPGALKSPWGGIQSGFLSSPYAGTCLQNFQVSVSGVPVFANPLTQAHQFYELWSQHTLNGGVVSSQFNSGLVDEEQWKNQYGAIITTFRHEAGTDDMSKNISVEWTNTSARTMSYLIFIYYEKSISVDCEKGVIVL